MQYQYKYDDTLRSLVDKHAPFADVKLHAHPNAPWYDSRCQVKKAKKRHLERAYRKIKNEESFGATIKVSTICSA